MELRESVDQLELRTQLRKYFAELMPEEERREAAEHGAGGQRFREIVRMLGRDGWLGVGWPTEYGGRGLTTEEQFIFYDEVQRAGVPFPLVTINTVGPALMEYGTPEQKEFYLPGMLRGEIIFAIGYTEPDAGTDLASLKTRADSDGQNFIVNGSKIFTTGGNTSDYVWLACRTDPTEPKHKGVSILIVPCDDPGYTWSPIHTVGGMSVTATYYSDVRVPSSSLVGDLNGGWKLITSQLNHERVALAALGGRTIQLWEQVREWAASNGLIHRPWVRREFARTYAKLEAMRLLNWKMTDDIGLERLTGATAAAVKTYGTETHIDVQRSLNQILGAGGRARPGSSAAVLDGQVEQLTRQSIVNTFGGGVNEVLRDIVATQGLGLPRVRR